MSVGYTLFFQRIYYTGNWLSAVFNTKPKAATLMHICENSMIEINGIKYYFLYNYPNPSYNFYLDVYFVELYHFISSSKRLSCANIKVIRPHSSSAGTISFIPMY